MDRKIPYHLKGKGRERGYSPPQRKRIRAPDLDTADLIEANSLTLMGRLTNPSVQRLWTLFPFLANRWNLKGKAVGSDLGRGCFQFRFDFEEDLQKVLDNRPYHYDHWMHFWKPEMLQTIGEEIGEVVDMEISISSVKIKIMIDGLQPLTKDTVVEFPDGREAPVTLEYKNLKNHCSHCLRLTHEAKHCPGLHKKDDQLIKQTTSSSHSRQQEPQRNYYLPRDGF
ncbi:unnamed protein product, partial [Arabidopsis halleri]